METREPQQHESTPQATESTLLIERHPGTGLFTPDSLPPPSGEMPGTRSSARRRPWKLPQHCHCPIVGTCLSVAELRRLARRAGSPDADQASDYDLHCSFVTSLRAKSQVSVLVRRELDRKYAAHISRFRQASDDRALLALWRTARRIGETGGALWASLTHPRAGQPVIDAIVADVHMITHEAMIACDAEARARREADVRIAALTSALESERAKSRTLDAGRHAANAAADRAGREIASLRNQLAETADRVRRLENGAALAAGAARIGALEAELAGARHHNGLLEAQVKNVTRDLREAQSPSRIARPAVLDHDGATFEGRDSPAGSLRAESAVVRSAVRTDHARAAETPDLGGRRVLCVGGKPGLVPRNCALIRRANGVPVHHDGGLENCVHRLPDLFSACDAVICPATHVSHDAYYRIKKYAKQTRKPCMLLASPGVSIFAKALAELAAKL